MRRRLSLLPVLIALTACAGPGAPAPAAPALAYRVPTPPMADYRVGDTAQVDLDAGGQNFPLTLTSSSLWRMEFAPAEGNRVRVTATLTELAARISNPLTADQSANESAVSGSVVFTLDQTGNTTVVSLPTLSEAAAAQFVNGSGIAYAFFPALPGRAVSAGDSWADTLAYTDDGGAGTTLRSTTTYTAVGDTLVGTSSYLLVRTSGTSEQSTTGELSGTDFSQTVAGTTQGYFLWDRDAGMLHSLEYRSDLNGTLQVEVVPVPMAVRVRGSLSVARVPR